MHICFIDESGTPAKPGCLNSRYFVIAGLVVPEEQWHDIRQKLIGLKRSHRYRGELKWRYFAANNANSDNPMLNWTPEQKDNFRTACFKIITSRRAVKVICSVCDAKLAYTLSHVNNQEDIYFGTYKIVTERFQYLLQDITRESGRFTSGIVVADHRNRGDDHKMRERHERLVRESTQYTSSYKNFIESIFLSPSHMSIDIQLVDLVAGAVWRKFEHNDDRWLETIRSAFRTNPAGTIDGYGISRFPERDWTGPIVD